MAWRTSSPALHAARVLLQHYSLTPRPREEVASGYNPALRATPEHLATVIDYASGVHYLVVLRPEIHYWQERLFLGTATAPQIGQFVAKMLQAFEHIPKYALDVEAEKFLPELPQGFRSRQLLSFTKAGIEATRYVLHYYAVVPEKAGAPSDINSLRVGVAKVIDVCLGMQKALKAEPLLQRCARDLKLGKMTEKEVRRAFREVGVFLDTMPTYGEKDDELKLLA